ncbi:MAG: hypothetical protein JRJ09_00850 [Deltaproteobacteria bacterium]|nr:hypothetical protein [Deltaproteobacteria bacterium]MBW2047064.1 hypothetical protein [Deltaproteobacteria bacterium]MBW2110507.1 hypothetical protein [Deltaproteobacteria bacterium]MBW2351605.1 hypothetical protein [Deltaproteobacteria bacterium]HDZ89438.1 hypothetical protein [Deltaproteobacteria bacterium]
MEKVLNITGRIEDRRRKQQVETHRDRFEAMQRLVQCSACHLKCAMCGRHKKGPEEPSIPGSRIPVEETLCEGCRSEFEAFKKLSKGGKKDEDPFWHNEEWRQLWTSWLEYQRSIMKFRNSFDFRGLTD